MLSAAVGITSMRATTSTADLDEQRGRGAAAVVGGLLIVHCSLLAWSAYRHSPTIDEVRWLPAGLYHWQTGQFNRGIANPPLPRVLAAVPVLAGDHQDLRESASAGDGNLVSALGLRSFWMFTLGRWALIPFSLIGGYVCYRWSQELYGTSAGLMALALWCFCPNLLGHFPIVANDAPAATAAVLAGYLFWHWLKSPTWLRVLHLLYAADQVLELRRRG